MRRRSFFNFIPTFLISAAWGSNFTLSPWILIFEPQNKIVSQIVTFTFQGADPTNPSKGLGPTPGTMDNAPVPVEISISAREVTPEGVVIYPSSKGAEDFVVYPSQFILYPGDSKRIQVQWVGSSVPSKEMSYGFIATQIPVDFKPTGEAPKKAVGIVSVASRYEGVLVVRPAGIHPEVVVDTAYVQRDTSGPSLVAVLDNKGSGMQSLKNLVLNVSPLDQSGKIRFDQGTVIKDIKSSRATSQSILAGFKRKVTVPWPTGLPVGPVHVAASFPDVPK